MVLNRTIEFSVLIKLYPSFSTTLDAKCYIEQKMFEKKFGDCKLNTETHSHISCIKYILCFGCLVYKKCKKKTN